MQELKIGEINMMINPTPLVELVTVVLLGGSVLCLVLCVPLALIHWLRRPRTQERRREEEEETRAIQQMYAAMTRLESRIEAIETILVDTERQKERIP